MDNQEHMEKLVIHITNIDPTSGVISAEVRIEQVIATRVIIQPDGLGQIKVGFDNPKPFLMSEVSVLSLMCQAYWKGIFRDMTFTLPTIKMKRDNMPIMDIPISGNQTLN
jgi:hypothetical protein